MKRTLDLSWGRIHKSRESCGVWFFRNGVWEVASGTGQYDRTVTDYKKAEDNNAPTLAASRFLQGSVTDSRGRVKPGFALVPTYTTSGGFFALKSGTGFFEQVIHSITSVNVLRECAVEPITLSSEPSVRPQVLGVEILKDSLTQQASNPIVSIDIHTSTVASRSLTDMHEHVSDSTAATFRATELWGQ